MADDASSRHLDAFLSAHAQDPVVPAALYARGQELHATLVAAPPAIPAWGRFLVAMGQLAAEHLDDPVAASRFFFAALRGAEHHGDHQAAVTAGYNQGVLHERRGQLLLALTAYAAAASEGFRLGVIAANTLRSASAAVRLDFAASGRLGQTLPLAKQAWLGWLYLARQDAAQLDAPLVEELGVQLCALLLPEEDPGQLAGAWRDWLPHSVPTPTGPWLDGDPACLHALFGVAAEAAARHLRDEGEDPGAPYHLLQAAARRMGPLTNPPSAPRI